MQMLRRIHYLLQGGELLFEDVLSLQQLPLLQHVVFRHVECRVQQMHDMLHVIHLHGLLTGSHCNTQGG